MGHLFALMFLDVKFETLTYSAGDYPASAPAISGRSTPSSGGELSAAPLSKALLSFWIWMRFHVVGCFAKPALRKTIPDSTPGHIFVVPSVNPDAPQAAVRVNRAILRKLRRLERLRPEVFTQKADLLPKWVKNLTPGQFMDYMIRTQNWCRVRCFGLSRCRGRSRRRRRRVFKARRSQPHAVYLALYLGRAASCQALLAPD